MERPHPASLPAVRPSMIGTGSLEPQALGEGEESQMRTLKALGAWRGSWAGSLRMQARQRWRGKVCAPPPTTGGASEPQG